MTLKSILAYIRRRRRAREERFKTRIFLAANPKHSRRFMIRGAKYQPVDAAVERDVADWLYPKQE